MKEPGQKTGLGLNIVISLIVFCIQFITILMSAAFTYLLIQLGVISSGGDWELSMGHIILFMVVISNVIGSVVAFVLIRFPLKFVSHIIHQINRLASGDFQARLYFNSAVSKHPSFAELAESFNKMAEELGNTEVLRSDFINNFSHEFKTPIVSIAGFAKLLKRGNLTEEQKKEYLDVIEEESLRLSCMATNVLSLTQVENQTILTDVSRFNLSEQLRSCILLLVDKWEKKELDFEVDFGEYTISANEEMLKQVWINLIDNAIKFSPEGGVLEIDIEDRADQVSVSVANSGEEISSENQKRIFNKFYQADGSHSIEGNGIGLAVVKRVVDLHNGRVAVYSEHHTTVFTVTLPKDLKNTVMIQ